MSASRPPWEYTINHVYFPPRLPQSDDSSAANDIALCELVIQNAQAFAAALSSDGQLWSPIIEMMRNLQRIYAGTALDKAVLQDIISKLSVGDTLVVPIRARNACVVFRAGDTSTIIESFEIDPPNQQVMAPTGRLIRRFPEAAFELANTPESASFQHELAAFLADMDAVDQDSAPSAVKAGSKVFEVRDTADPHHIVQMMNAIVHGFPGSKPYEVERIEKRVRNEILCDNSREPSPWRRSPLWLIIRVALQTTLCRESVSGITEYKSFMIFMLSDIILSSDDYKSFSADILVCIQNKIVRRFRKLSDAMSRDLMHRSTEAISKAKDILEARWGELKKQQALSPPWAPDSLDIPADTNISLVSSKAYLLRRLQESVNPPAKHVFQPSETRHINDDDLLSPQRVLEALSGDPFMTLVDLEQIAIYRLDGWVDKYSSNSSACLALGECITHYAAAACKAYDNPEDRSMMMLTIFVLWSGFDRLAIILHPLLADYSPEISCDILEPILLRKFDSIHALICLKEYLQKRHSRASRGSVYEETLSTSSFAIRYFTSSSVLNQLKRDIEKEARAQREEKRAEFSRLSARYTELIRRAQTLQHFCWDSGYYRPWNCTKCSLERQASKLTISVHEWPLPSDTLYAQATVFELQCPPVFQAWRTITYTILSDHCRLPKYERSDRMAISLAGHSPLTRYCKEQSRITYASSTRPFVEAHYSTQAIAHVFDDLSSILVNCGLRFSLFDYGQSSWIHTPSTSECSIEPLCNFTILPSSPYYSLEYAVKGTMHSANKPLADQADAHPDLSVHEHIAFGTLRSGHQIQWLNIVRSLRERILSFDRFEVHLLIAEAAQQTGWIKDAGLEWHNMLKQLDFGLTLLSEIDDMMSTIKSNWHHINTLYSLIILTVRLLGACTDDDVVVRAYSTLRMAREVAYAWVLRLLEDLKHADSDAPSTLDLLRQHICLAAATCRATYDVDPRHFDSLIAGDNDVHKLIHCAIQIQDNQPREKKPTELNLFLARDRKLSFVLEPIIQKRIEASRGGIDAAILAVWSDYKEGSPWKHLTIPNERWFTSIIIDASTLTQSVVHYNLTDGTLLIDGKPLGRLPSSIVGHPTYKRILGKKIFDVVPSILPQMDFSTRSALYAPGLSLHFRTPDSSGNLIIQAKVGEEIFELIPPGVFGSDRMSWDFPMSFVNEYAHWMHLSTTLTTGYIEFHPLTAVWNPSEVNWRLEFPNDLSRGVMMGDNGASMLDRRSKTFQMISRHLEPLDAPDHLHVMLDAAGTLTAHLARYNMSFFVNGHKELECLTIRDMVVDSNQSCGAMFGLQNQLLLRGKSLRNTRIRAPGSRCCIIPFGKAEVSNTRVTVSRRGGVQKYFVYQLDTTLGQLNGTTFLSDIYKIYLHACTSYPLPDDLTGRTGIEEALYEVDSARFLSFLELGTEDAAVLRYIADLTPNLQWYPSHHHRTMQISHWKDFGFLSQHPALVSRVKVIFRYHQQLSSMGMGIVHDTSAATTETDSHLLARLDSRTTGLYASGRQSAPHYSDMVYSGRQPCRASDDTIKLTADVSAYVHSIATIDSLHTITNLWDELQLIQRLHNDEIHSYAEFICPNLSLLFLPLYKAIQRGQQSESFISKLAIILAIMVYTSDNPRVKKLVPTFITFARFPEFRTISPPSANYYDLTLGVSPDFQVITKCLMQFKLPPPTDLPIRRDTENDFEYDQRHDKYWASALGEQVDGFVRILIQQWPCKTPSIPLDQQARAKFYLLDLPSPDLESEINQLFVAWFDNKQLQEFVNELQPILDRVHLSHDPSIPRTVELYKVPPSICAESVRQRHLAPTLYELLCRHEPRLAVPESVSLPVTRIASSCGKASKSVAPADISQLQAIVEQFSQSSQVLQRVYGSALVGSLKSYLDRRIQDQRPQRFRTMSNFLLENDYEIRRREFWNFHQLLEITLHPKTPLEVAEFLAGQRPIPTVRTLLTSILSKDSAQTTVPHTWQSAGKMLAQRLVRLQRARRVILFQASGRWEDLSKELDNADFESTISFTNSEWLLIQIASDFTVRSVQNHVAQEMISPRSERNSLTQLNMGEGKSAVIVPLVSSSLSDGKKLVRVVTLKSLAKQMFNLLVHRLSGLANRRIFYLPFSRDFTANPSNLNQLHSLYETCVNEKGILLVQPEHILSFRLMGIDLATGSHGNAGKILLESHRWLMSVSRDILDESDEILRANYQLVYTSGIQQPMDGHPDRWTIIQEVIGYAQKHAVILRPTYESGLDVQRTGEIGCPIVRILSDDAGEALIDSVVSEVLSNDRLKLMPSHLCLAASDFITCRRSSATAFKRLKSFLQESSTWKYLLLYRGLLGRGLLQFVLREKRWRVDYGLDTSRTLLAVPYRAKDLPSLRSDFGHPDVALLLTCLSYYNGGLTESQLDKCFELLFKLDDPPLVYNQWVSGRGAEIPHLFRDLKGINLDDAHQRKTVLGPLFLKNKAVIDFYLSKVVFPRYAKEFPKRLATSSWDLAEIKTHVTTGFSGTNDNRYLLPTSIEQDDATTVGENDAFGQHATNAKVLDILLQAENDNYFCLQPEGSRDNESPTGSDYLHLLVKQNPPVRVLLDVGAQMLDMQSDDLASKWLSLVPEIQAVVFFDKRDELVVMSRGNHIEKFEVSEYNRKLDNCAIYLDDAHTRGTDLKLPIYFRAVVTLGPKLTKDRLVQGCMRMRQLGRGQTVVYFAPMEVDRNIRVCPLFPLDNSAKITASDILRWAMWQSCEYIRHYIPHWAQQGIEYKHRNDAWTLHENGRSAPEPNALETLRASWEQLDARTLDEMYEAQPDAKVTPVHAAYEMPHLKERLDRLGISSLEDPRTDEEQERQVAQEAEQEHQRELPPKLEPAVSTLHKDVALLVTSGIFNSSSSTSPFIPLFSPLGTIHQWSTALFSTKDFARTIKGEDLAVGDFLRPVNWIISVPGRRVLIVLSPFEVNELLTRIQNSKHIHLHLYSPRVNRNMKTTEDLRFYSIPMLPAIDSPLTPDPLGFIPAPMLQLNLWAGQLYLKDLETYQQLCRVLGLVGAEYGSPLWDSDGFIKPEHRVGPMKEECQMLISPVKFLKDVLSLRRKGMGFEPTHMGRVLSAKLLDITHFC